MNMVNKLNELIQKYNVNHHEKKYYRDMIFDSLKYFKDNGEGLYICNLKSKANNIVAKAIGAFSEYQNLNGSAKLSHSVIIYYGDITKYLDNHRIDILKSKLSFYYVDHPDISEIPAIVLASADDTGMNYFSFSNYQYRDYSLRKVDVGMSTGNVICWLIDQHDVNYDFTGLVFWPFYKLFKFLGFLDDSKSWFCSELCYEAFINYCIFISIEENPSPADIEYYNDRFPDIYRTRGFLS